MLNLKYNRENSQSKLLTSEEESLHDIAIIGVSARLPQADNHSSFWNKLCSGTDAITSFPKSRRQDVEQYVDFKNSELVNQYCKGSYLQNIDHFDHEFFKIPAKEASLMDPNQRVFLETAWAAIEDAGYGGDRLLGSSTGIYVGFSGRGEYQTFISEIQPESVILSEAGNIQSIIASRLAYILDLKGPSLLVDTACSSSLVSVHMACQAIRNYECEMAIAGGIKISFLPLELDDKLGIESSSGKTKTFDDTSDGTVFGEGSVALILKPLQRAMNDNDHIYAVIKGSAVNQDGQSIGITAPNVLAQESCIIQAWENAAIDPTTITYMEAHGTGTHLGDPVEVDAISRAFRRYTDKKQFCGIGSIKSVYGHLDHAAGILGLLKVVMMLKNRKIAPTLNFNTPNRNIDFISSPLYIADQVQEWKTEKNQPRRCGVSSFGLSGTNCHLVLEEAPQPNEESNTIQSEENSMHLYCLSAKKKHILNKMITTQRIFAEDKINEDIRNICFTANSSRIHGAYRLAILARDMDELARKLRYIEEFGLLTYEENDIYYGSHFVVPNIKEQLEIGEMYASHKNKLTQESINLIKNKSDNKFSIIDLRKICNIYIQGGDIAWKSYYQLMSKAFYKVSMPGYSFEKKRCWPSFSKSIVPSGTKKKQTANEIQHPFIKNCAIESIEQDVYIAKLSIEEHWVLKEHKIADKNILPGTAYLDMIQTICTKYYLDFENIEIRDVFFLQPLIVQPGQIMEVQLIVKKREDHFSIIIVSKLPISSNWVKYCEAKVYSNPHSSDLKGLNSLESIYARMKPIEEDQIRSEDNSFDFGPRWTTLLDKLLIGKEEVVAEFSLSESLSNDLHQFYLHPSLLDVAVNVASQVTGNGLYLPMSYKSIKVFSPLPSKIISHVILKNSAHMGTETISFDITIYDGDGNEVFLAKDFTVKKVNSLEFNQHNRINSSQFYQINWIPVPDLTKIISQEKFGINVFIRLEDDNYLINDLSSNSNIIEVIIGGEFKQISAAKYICSGSKEDFKTLFHMLKDININKIVHMTSITCNENLEGSEDIDKIIQNSIYNLKNLVKSWIDCKKSSNTEIILLSKNANQVTEKEVKFSPLNAAYLTWGQSIPKEYPNLSSRAIDIDDNTPVDMIEREIFHESEQYITAIRNQLRYQKVISRSRSVNSTTRKLPLQQNGVYLISGGTGGLGSEIAKFLTNKEKIHLILIGKSPVDTWDTNYKQRYENTKKHIESLGSTVEYFSVDISDEQRVQMLLRDIKQIYKKINGIIHAAGVASNGYIINRNDKESNQVLRSKIHGAWILDKYTVNEKLDFFISFSSISSLYGLAGQSDYAAANAYLDEFSKYRNSKGHNSLTINWAPWRDIGMAVDNGVQDNGVFKMLEISEGLEAFEDIFSIEKGSIIVGRLNKELLVANKEEADILFHADILKELQIRKQASIPHKSNDFVTTASRMNFDNNDNVLDTVIGIWRNILGIEDLSIYESFNALGGDSITATRLFKEIDKVYPGKIDIGSIFAYPSIHEIAKYIENLNEKELPISTDIFETSDDLLDDVLMKVREQSLTISEAIKLI